MEYQKKINDRYLKSVNKQIQDVGFTLKAIEVFHRLIPITLNKLKTRPIEMRIDACYYGDFI